MGKTRGEKGVRGSNERHSDGGGKKTKQVWQKRRQERKGERSTVACTSQTHTNQNKGEEEKGKAGAPRQKQKDKDNHARQDETETKRANGQ
jgi:hypothetical protein